MTVLWLVVPLLAAAVIITVIRVETRELDEVARRHRAMKRLEAISGGQGVPSEDERSPDWFASPDGRWPRRVRVFRYGPHSTGSVVFEEPET